MKLLLLTVFCSIVAAALAGIFKKILTIFNFNFYIIKYLAVCPKAATNPTSADGCYNSGIYICQCATGL